MSYKEDVQKAFNFQIEKHHLSGCGVETPFFGLFRSDTMATVGHAVSRRYVPHTTDDVLALVESSSAAFGADCEVKCGFFNRHYVAIQPTREHRVSVYGTEDNIYPRVIVNAGYGGSAFKVSVGYYRDLCKNMSIMRMVKGSTVSIRHTSGLRARMDELIRTFANLHDSWKAVSSAAQRMQQVEIDLASYMESVYGEPGVGAAATIHKKRTEAIVSRVIQERQRSYRPELGNDRLVSVWEAWNAVQGFSQHDSRRKANTSELSRAILSMRDGAVRRAEKAAMKAIAV